LNSGNIDYYSYVPTAQYQFQHVVVGGAGVNRTSQKFFLSGKRAGFPLFEKNEFVDSSYDWEGSNAQNLTDIHLDYPRGPDSYWFAVISNDTKNIPYTITLTIGNPASVDELNASIPEFDTKKENNTISYASTKGVKSFTYFRFDDSFIKLGIAPQDDSDPTPDVFADVDSVPSPDSNILSNTNPEEPAHLLYATTQATTAGFVWYSFEVAQPSFAGSWYVGVNSTTPLSSGLLPTEHVPTTALLREHVMIQPVFATVRMDMRNMIVLQRYSHLSG